MSIRAQLPRSASYVTGVTMALISVAALAERVPFEGTQYYTINPVVHQFKSGAAIVHWRGNALMATKDPNSIFQNLRL